MSLLAILFVFNFLYTATASDQPFAVSLRLLKPVVISEVRSLAFPDTTTGTTSQIVVSSTGDTAAKFEVVGSANSNIVSTVVEHSIVMSAPSVSDPIVVDGFTVQAPLALNELGKASVGVGGTAHINNSNEDGDYSGSATLRVIYE